MGDLDLFDELDTGRALPNLAYRSTTIHDAELDGVFGADWVFVTTADVVAEPGDRIPVVVGRQPVMLLRDRDGELAALSNLCTHRGTLLVGEPTNGKRIQCPYHAWTFADDGRLLAVPFDDAKRVDKAAHCLPSYRVEEWHGLVFVSLNPDVEPLAERFAGIEHHVGGLDDLHHWGGHQESQEWACNWKLAAINAMESYHLFQVHPETLEPFTPTKGAYHVGGDWRASVTGGTEQRGDDYVLLSLPPGFVGVVTNGSFLWQTVHPVAVDRCVVRTGAAYRSPPPERAGRLDRWVSKAAMAAESLVPDFLPEDKAICERGQLGAAGDFTPGTLVEMEQVVVDFHDYLRRRLGTGGRRV